MDDKGLVSKSALTAIADAIRAKNNTSATMLPGEMAELITAISTGVELPTWINEIKFSRQKLTTASASVQIPCRFTPTHLVVFAETKPPTNYTVESSVQAPEVSGIIKVKGSTGQHLYGATITVDGNILTIDYGNLIKLDSGIFYCFIMWR